MGRPTDYTPEIGDYICSELASGRSLRSICMDENMPCAVTVYAWRRKFAEFANNYEASRLDQADTLADDIIFIADEKPTLEVVDGVAVTDPQFHQRQRLRVDARKWIAAKMKPKKYGDKLTQEHTGDGGGPVQHKVTVEFVD